MRHLASRRVRLLIAANLLALVVIFTSGNVATAQWETYCPPTATGCDCLFDVPLNPDGCFDNNGPEILCSSNQFCFEPEEN